MLLSLDSVTVIVEKERKTAVKRGNENAQMLV
jgi:hypothetical protein